MIVTVTLNPAIDKKIATGDIILGETNKCILERCDISGKGINVSKVVASLGCNTVATGFLGGNNAKMFTDYLSLNNISHNFVKIDCEIRTNIKLVENNTGRETEINENGPVVTTEQVKQFLTMLNNYYKKEDILCVSGSLPGGVEPEIYTNIILSAKAAGMRTIFDSSENSFRAGVEAAPFAIKPNMYEMETYFKERIHTLREIKQKALYFINKGIETVVLSMGREGACFINKNNAVRARIKEKLTVRGTIGAGDAICGALAVSLQNNMDFESTVRLCIASASACVIEEGTVPGSAVNIERFKNLIEIEKID